MRGPVLILPPLWRVSGTRGFPHRLDVDDQAETADEFDRITSLHVDASRRSSRPLTLTHQRLFKHLIVQTLPELTPRLCRRERALW